LIGKIGQGTKGGGPLICTGCTYQPIWCSAALDGFSHWLLTENCMRWGIPNSRCKRFLLIAIISEPTFLISGVHFLYFIELCLPLSKQFKENSFNRGCMAAHLAVESKELQKSSEVKCKLYYW